MKLSKYLFIYPKTNFSVHLSIFFSFLSTYAFSETFSNPKPIFTATDFWESMAFKQVRPTHEDLLNSSLFSQIQEIYENFVKQIANSDSVDYSIPPKSGAIPSIIHFIWLGSELPIEAKISIDSWRKYHPGWKIKIWKDVDLKNFQWTTDRTEKNFYEAESYAEKADILRYEILYQFGGIYSDTDVICLKPFHDLIASDIHFFSAIEVNWVSKITKNPLHVGTAIMGAVKGSHTMRYCIEHHIGLNEDSNEHILNRTGPGLCTRSVIHNMEERSENILLLPVSYFYPFPFEHRHLKFEKAMTYRAPETMAIHLWSGSWLSKEELEKIKQKSISSGYVTVEDE